MAVKTQELAASDPDRTGAHPGTSHPLPTNKTPGPQPSYRRIGERERTRRWHPQRLLSPRRRSDARVPRNGIASALANPVANACISAPPDEIMDIGPIPKRSGNARCAPNFRGSVERASRCSPHDYARDIASVPGRSQARNLESVAIGRHCDLRPTPTSQSWPGCRRNDTSCYICASDTIADKR